MDSPKPGTVSEQSVISAAVAAVRAPRRWRRYAKRTAFALFAIGLACAGMVLLFPTTVQGWTAAVAEWILPRILD